jgi:hypothetical protein
MVLLALGLAETAVPQDFYEGERRKRRIQCWLHAENVPGVQAVQVTGGWTGTSKYLGVVSLDGGASAARVGNPFTNIVLPYTYGYPSHVVTLDVGSCHAEFVLPEYTNNTVQQ